MRTLVFDNSVYEDGAGRIYSKIMSWTLPGLILATLEIALINTGILKVDSVPPVLLKLIGLLTVIYVIPSIFAFPTAWFLSSGKTRLLKTGSIDLYKKKIVYHQAASMTMATPRMVDWSVTQLKRVEKKRGYYILYGAVTNETAGGSDSQLRIPAAFEDMHLISEMARYH